MASETLMAQVKSLELQLEVLKARLRDAGGSPPSRPFSELEGMLEGLAETTDDEIEAATYRVDWPEEEGGGE